MRKRNIVILAASSLACVALASCQNDKNVTDTSSLQLEVTKNWFMNGFDLKTVNVSSIYSNKIYDPTNDENFDKSKSYFTIYAASAEETVRMVETKIDANSLNGVNNVLYLQTSAFGDDYKNEIASKISDNKTAISSSITSFEADVQTTWKKSLDEYGITSTKENVSNYLEVLYVPLFVRVYSSYKEDNTTLTLSTFVCVPVKTFITTFENDNYQESLANTFKDKKATYDYDLKNLIIR